MNYQKEIIIRGIKIIDIGYVTTIYIILGIILAKLIDRYYGKFDKEKEEKKPLWQSILELILLFWIIGIVIYVIRNLIRIIPFPLNRIYGYDHLRLKELALPTIFVTIFLYFQEYYQAKIKYIYSHL
jgi:hypothetical protein